MVDGAFDRPGRPAEPAPENRPDPWEEFEDGVIGRMVEDARRRSGDAPAEPRRPPPWEEPEGVIERLTRPADGWVDQPIREFQRPVNASYEAWVREETGGHPRMEYAVADGKGGVVHFDSRLVDERGEVLIDAKASYAQFLDGNGEWREFFTESTTGGLPVMMKAAERQVDAADGRPVEWWCMQSDVAEAFNDAFARSARLRDRIEAVYRPMPERETTD